MKKIADEVNIKPASIYYFFKNKDELFLSVFKKILIDHFDHLKKSVKNSPNEPINETFSSLLRGSIKYHQDHPNETNVYISLITAPPDEFKNFLYTHMRYFNTWLDETLIEILMKKHTHITLEHAKFITKQFNLLMDGLFWQMNFLNEHDLEIQMDNVLNLMNLIQRRD